MILALLAAAAAVQPPPPSIPPPPPPPPVATTPAMLADIETARTCFDQRWEVAGQARFAAERLVRPLTAALGSAEWLAARGAVLALVEARRNLRDCAIQLDRSANAANDADRAARRFWTEQMVFNIDNQASWETALLIGLVDRTFLNPVLGRVTKP